MRAELVRGVSLPRRRLLRSSPTLCPSSFRPASPTALPGSLSSCSLSRRYNGLAGRQRSPASFPFVPVSIDTSCSSARELSTSPFPRCLFRSIFLSPASNTECLHGVGRRWHASSTGVRHEILGPSLMLLPSTYTPIFGERGRTFSSSDFLVATKLSRALLPRSRACGVRPCFARCTYTSSARQHVWYSRRNACIEKGGTVYYAAQLNHCRRFCTSQSVNCETSLQEYLFWPRCTYTSGPNKFSSSQRGGVQSGIPRKEHGDCSGSSAILQDPTGSLGAEGDLLSFDLHDAAVSSARCRAVHTLGDATNDSPSRSFRLIIEWTAYLLLFLLLGATMTGQLTIIERRIDLHLKSLCILTAIYGGMSLWGFEVARLGGKEGPGVGCYGLSTVTGGTSFRYVLGCCSVGLSSLPLIVSEVLSPCAGYMTLAIPVLYQLLCYRFLKHSRPQLLPPLQAAPSRQTPSASKTSSHCSAAPRGSPLPFPGSPSSSPNLTSSSSLSFSSSTLSPSSSSCPVTTAPTTTSPSVPRPCMEREGSSRCGHARETPRSAQTQRLRLLVEGCHDTTSVSSFISPDNHEKSSTPTGHNSRRDSLLLPRWWGQSWRQKGLPLVLLVSAALGCYRVKQVEDTACTTIAKDAESSRPLLPEGVGSPKDVHNATQKGGLWRIFLPFLSGDDENEGGECASTESPGVERDREDEAVLRRARERLLRQTKTPSGGRSSSQGE